VASFLPSLEKEDERLLLKLFSSLSESGFIPTFAEASPRRLRPFGVLISFREWLHSYKSWDFFYVNDRRIAFSSLSESGFIPTIKEVSVSLMRLGLFSSLSESGFIPTVLV